jgi:hypothetical protein
VEVSETHDIEELHERIRALEDRAAALAPSEDADGRLIEAIDRCEASPEDLRRLARRLRPYVRAQILRGGWWRTMFEGSGEKLSFMPVWPIEAAVEVCRYTADNDDWEDDRFVATLAEEPNLDFERLTKSYRGGGMAVVSWKHSAELVLVREAIGEPTCRELREILDEAAETGEWPEEAQLLASDRQLRLVQPLGSLVRHYPIVSDTDLFPWISPEWS